MKKLIILIITLTVFLPTNLLYEPTKGAEQAIEYEGNKVFINDSKAYLSASPHTLGSSGWVEFELISKVYTGNADVAFGFNTSDVKPTRIQAQPNGSTNWVDINLDINTIHRPFKNVSTWHVARNLPIQEGKLYKIRIYLEIKFKGLEHNQGEYYFAIKPSGETINEAIERGHLYWLDPWWDTDWECRVPIWIESDYISAALTNFPIAVNISTTIGGQCQADGDDIRFTLSDNSTLLNYEFDTWNAGSSYSIVWVNVTTISHTDDTLIWLYYNNDAATCGEKPYGTWDGNYIAVYHCNNAYNLYDSTQHNRNTTNKNTGTNKSGAWGGSILFDGAADYYMLGGQYYKFSNQPFMIECWTLQPARDGSYRYYMNKGKSGASARLTLFSGTSGSAYDLRGDAVDTGNEGIYPRTGNGNHGYDSNWHYNTMRKLNNDLFTLQFNMYAFDAAVCTEGDGTNEDIDVAGDDMVFGANYAHNSYWHQGRMDEIRISVNTSRSDAWRNATYHNQNESDFLRLGASECQSSSYIIWTLDAPSNGTSICPCCFPVNFTIEQTDGNTMNITIWTNHSGTWEIISDELINLINGTHGTVICSFNNLDTTYYWNATITDDTTSNATSVYWVKTYSDPDNQCFNGTSDGSSSSTSSGIVGIVGIIGILGFLAYIRRRKK